MAGLSEGGNEPPGSLKAILTHIHGRLRIRPTARLLTSLRGIKNYEKLLSAFCHHPPLRKLRFETLETCILPVILYGCQTWALSTKQYAAIQTCQRKMQRKILGVTLKDKLPNDSLQKLANTSDAPERAMMSKWKCREARDENGALKMDARDHNVGPIHRKKEPGKTTTQMGGYVCEDDGQQWSRKARDRSQRKELGLIRTRNS
ncbi:hypothetical protein ANN_22289 [Periplaneta americana]|uniref:Endonuclease-reverse transcriptase n=1 Tax=Periplaneta americana TaxID=6978 RepID=A0ABQ8S8M4_PERAM|nr:hypothetical protein ANN_22289 [Periplaneta americana]